MPARPSTMPPLAAADAFLVLEFLAGNRSVPSPVFSALLAALPSVSGHTSPLLRKSVVLRALDAALSDASCADASVLLSRARAVLADHPDLASFLPDHLAVCDDLPGLKRLVDAEWASLPPSTLETAADRIVGAGVPDTWASADQDTRTKLRLLVGESTEREILGKIGQNSSGVPLVDKAANAPSTSGANEANCAQQDDEVHLGRENGKADHVQEGCARQQQDPVEKDEVHLGRENDKADHVQEGCARQQQEPVERTTHGQLPEKSVTSAAIKGKDKATSSNVTGEIAPDNNNCHPVKRSKPSLMERNPTARVFEWDDSLGDSDPGSPAHRRQLPTYEVKRRPPPAFPHKTRKRWSEIEEQTLIEGVEKYGKGSWKDIKLAYPRVFADRSQVDLKDKFRNMERHMIN